MPGLTFVEILILCVLPVLLVASAFFSGSETALFSLTRHQLFRMHQSRSLAGGIVATLLSETRMLLITLLLGNMVVNVLYFVLSTVLLLRLQQHQQAAGGILAVLSVVPLILIILLGEVLPKLLATRIAPTWAQLSALPLFVIHRGLGPLRMLLNIFIITPLARLIAPRQRPAALSADELEMLFDLSKHHGVINHDEEEMLSQVLELGQLKVRELMTPRVDIEAHDLDDPPAELLQLIRRTRLSHIPVYKGDIDNIQGVIYARQALLKPLETYEAVQSLIRQVKFVPEQQRADQLLVDLRKTGTTFAIVVDEYGGTAGLITLEDIVEHMVGQIPGPYDRTSDDLDVKPLGHGIWQVDSNLPVREWEEVFTEVWPLQHGDNHGINTLGGLVMAKLDRLPHVGDCVQLGNVSIEVQSMESRRIKSLLVRITQTPPHDTQAEATP